MGAALGVGGAGLDSVAALRVELAEAMRLKIESPYASQYGDSNTLLAEAVVNALVEAYKDAWPGTFSPEAANACLEALRNTRLDQIRRVWESDDVARAPHRHRAFARYLVCGIILPFR